MLPIFSLLSGVSAGLSEARGDSLKYSKFWNVEGSAGTGSSSRHGVNISSRRGMLVCYTPAFLIATASFTFATNQYPRSLLLSSALVFHFLKRILEVLLVHRYSGGMEVKTACTISLSYALSSFLMVYYQRLGQGVADPAIDLKWGGVVLFLVGEAGNFYHHYLLARLRKEDGGYQIPTGGLFSLVVCPHYLFEIMVFVGIAFVSQTSYAFSFALFVFAHLMGRSYSTRRWYVAKFEDFPTRVKALIPFLF
ncbi:unnamed protein product [Victoria cruziana]